MGRHAYDALAPVVVPLPADEAGGEMLAYYSGQLSV